MTDTPKIDIPAHHQEMCRAIARVCREHGLEKFSGRFTPKFRDPWPDEISFSWEQGRHGEDSDRLFITSQLRVYTRLGTDRTDCQSS